MPAIDTLTAPLVLRHGDGREQLIAFALRISCNPPGRERGGAAPVRSLRRIFPGTAYADIEVFGIAQDERRRG